MRRGPSCLETGIMIAALLTLCALIYVASSHNGMALELTRDGFTWDTSAVAEFQQGYTARTEIIQQGETDRTGILSSAIVWVIGVLVVGGVLALGIKVWGNVTAARERERTVRQNMALAYVGQMKALGENVRAMQDEVDGEWYVIHDDRKEIVLFR